MNEIITALQANSRVSDYKINVTMKESYELFFVKGTLETIRVTDTCDKAVTVYAAHGDCLGSAEFYVYPYTTHVQLTELIDDAVEKALLINNASYKLPEKTEGHYKQNVDYSPEEIASVVADTVFHVPFPENCALNAVEIFINKYCQTVVNSNGLNKTQIRYNGMVEAIPTYNGEAQSVELYEQLNFGTFSPEILSREIAQKLQAVKARYEAVKPDFSMNCKVLLNVQELNELFENIVYNMKYATVYSHSGVFTKGDMLQKNPTGDRITITMRGQAEGSARSSWFDRDGMDLSECTLVENGIVTGYYGSNRYGQLLGETPTGLLECLCVAPGSLSEAELRSGAWLEVVSMSGLQVDFYTDYLGGEVRLAYYHDGEKTIPVTGISISGSLEQALSSIRLSSRTTAQDSYVGPELAALDQMQIF